MSQAKNLVKVLVKTYTGVYSPGEAFIEEEKLPYMLRQGLVELIGEGAEILKEGYTTDGKAIAQAIADHLEIPNVKESETTLSLLQKIADYFEIKPQAVVDSSSPEKPQPPSVPPSDDLKSIVSFRDQLEVYLPTDTVDKLIEGGYTDPESIKDAAPQKLEALGLTKSEIDILDGIQFK